MLESFYIRQHPDLVDTQWRKKTLLSSEILGQDAERLMRPELFGDRSRLDLMWYQKSLGLRGPVNESNEFSFFEIPSAPDTVHPSLGEMLEPFKNSGVPNFLEMAQIRFRCDSKKQLGIWIDCSNANIKELLQEEKWLQHLVKNLNWKVELGQKQKEVYFQDGKLSFEKAQAHNWLSSFDSQNEEIPLVSYISAFSQPGPEANRALMACGLELLDRTSSVNGFCEWGAGYGNLTACYSSVFKHSNWSSELESAGVECLKLNHKYFLHTLIESQNAGQGTFPNQDLWILDPPRSGFGKLLSRLSELKEKPRYILNYHCHNVGLLNDTKILKASGYQLQAWSSVDIFPATPYHEVISLWKIL